MPIAIKEPPAIPAKNKLYSLIREPSFYQEAYVASFAYIQAIGNRLRTDWGFRLVEESDVAKYQTFLASNPENLLLNLISSSTISIHIIQLPKQLSSLELSSKGQSGNRLSSTFTTILTSGQTRITENTHTIPPLRDLISFLQCLLPSSDALTLSLNSPSSFGRCLGTSEDDSRTSQEEIEEVEEERISVIDTWRQDVQIGIPRIPTPSPKWLDQNEDMLRDTVGCGYYRRLREVAEDQKDVSDVLVKVEDVTVAE